ncbi:FIG00992460: hypothetical protein [hydrothermal vent metagenome]|uniref:Uncharacterized protein n=1 Tax=hydrothermal vent metagenome TaxID=652676 RepID=A0A3B0SBM8_9ZZZZ
MIPDANGTIDGLIAAVPGDDWAALDLREAAYDRLPATHLISHDLNHQPEIAVYAIPDDKHQAPSADHPVLLSYIDVVAQGYLREFGEGGATRFFTTTDGWDMPVLDDRAAPVYPRHQRLTRSETAFVDDQLRGLSARIMQPPRGSVWT